MFFLLFSGRRISFFYLGISRDNPGIFFGEVRRIQNTHYNNNNFTILHFWFFLTSLLDFFLVFKKVFLLIFSVFFCFFLSGIFQFSRSAVDCFDLTNFFPYFFSFSLHHLINSGLESAVLVVTIVFGFFFFFLNFPEGG